MYSLHVPPDLNYIVDKIVKTKPSDFADVINLILKCRQQNNYEQINLYHLVTKLNLNIQESEDYLSVLLTLINWCKQLRSYPIKEQNDSIERSFGTEWTNQFLTLINTDSSISSNNCVTQINKLYWRIDISLYNEYKKIALSPVIILNLKLSNGKTYNLELTMKKFHEIRFTITTLLKELGIVKKSSLVKKSLL